MKNIKNILQSMISDDNLMEAIDTIRGLSGMPEEIVDDIILQRARLKEIERNELRGVSIHTEERNKIRIAALEIIKKIPEIEENQHSGLLNKFKASAVNFVNGYLNRSKSKYRYINLYANIVKQGKKIPKGSLQESVTEIILSDSQNNVAILGEFGSGKTTFAFNFLYECLRMWLKDKFDYLPILLRFRDYNWNLSIFDWILDQILLLPHNILITKEELIQLLHEGKLVLILDGLDEIPHNGDKRKINKLMNEAHKLASLKSPIIVTCRTTFFLDYSDSDVLRSFNRLYIDTLNKHQKSDYIKNSIGNIENTNLNGVELIRLILEEDDSVISKITNRPLFLNLIIDLYKEEENIMIQNKSDLYDKLTTIWIKKEETKSSLRNPIKRIIIRLIAEKVTIENNQSITLEEIREVLKSIPEEFSNYSITQLDVIVHELINTAFFDVTISGKIEFCHKSFAEFFFAEKIEKDILKKEFKNIARQIYYEEIFEFVGEIFSNKGNMHYLHEVLINPKIETVAKINVIPPIRKQKQKESIPFLIEALLNDTNPAIKFITGYTLSIFQEKFPNEFNTIIVSDFKKAYRTEKNDLVRLRLALLISNGNYNDNDISEYPVLNHRFPFDKKSVQEVTNIYGTINAYKIILENKRENDFVIEEAIRILSIYAKYENSSFLDDSTLKIILKLAEEDTSPRIRISALLAIDLLGMNQLQSMYWKKSQEVLQKAADSSDSRILEAITRIRNYS